MSAPSARGRFVRESALLLVIGVTAGLALSFSTLSDAVQLRQQRTRVSTFAESEWSRSSIAQGLDISLWAAECMNDQGVNATVLDGGEGISLKWDYTDGDDVERIRRLNKLCVDSALTAYNWHEQELASTHRYERLVQAAECLRESGYGMTPHIPSFDEFEMNPDAWSAFSDTPLGGWTVFSLEAAVTDQDTLVQMELQERCPAR